MEEREDKKIVRVTDNHSVKKTGRSFQIVEAYKTLRTNLLFTLATTDQKIVVITSPQPHAGKSTTSTNLSIVMAQSNFKVLLIDADMRKPSLDRSFRVGRTDGLSRVLSGMSTFEETVVRQVVPNLDLLVAGPIPPNQQELLGSQKMKELLEEASQQYDYIFIDTPPVNVVADALMVLDESVGMLLVVREGETTHEELRAAEEAVGQVGGNLLGVLLTNVRPRKGLRREKYYKSSSYEYSEK